ncbi:hypothetical protein ABID82_004777 [Methylobacterium sp. PvP062]
MQRGPDPGRLPYARSPPARLAAAANPRARQVPPRRSRAPDQDDTGRPGSIRHARPTIHQLSRLRRQKRLHDGPKVARQESVHDLSTRPDRFCPTPRGFDVVAPAEAGDLGRLPPPPLGWLRRPVKVFAFSKPTSAGKRPSPRPSILTNGSSRSSCGRAHLEEGSPHRRIATAVLGGQPFRGPAMPCCPIARHATLDRSRGRDSVTDPSAAGAGMVRACSSAREWTGMRGNRGDETGRFGYRFSRRLRSVGPVAQWLEPAAHNGLVAGSSPAGPTSLPRSRGIAGWQAPERTRGAPPVAARRHRPTTSCGRRETFRIGHG